MRAYRRGGIGQPHPQHGGRGTRPIWMDALRDLGELERIAEHHQPSRASAACERIGEAVLASLIHNTGGEAPVRSGWTPCVTWASWSGSPSITNRLALVPHASVSARLYWPASSTTRVSSTP